MNHAERYEAIITRDPDGRIEAIELVAHNLEDELRRVRVQGVQANQVTASVQEVLRVAYPRRRSWSAPTFELDPVAGAHVELLLRAIKPLRRLDRICGVAEGVAAMSREEAAYWHAQTTRRHGLRALRILIDSGSSR